MTINPSDIKLLESERMTDYTDGGGRRTSRVIPDGVAGNIFPKVSRLDSVYGRVNIRKVYGGVMTNNLDTYAGAHAVITDPPDNDRINCLLFTTKSEYDTRNAARDRIESYVIYGPESRMILYGRQLIGQMALLVYQRVEDPLPEVGEVFALITDSTGEYQYVRITDVDHEVRIFTDNSGDFTRRVLSLKIGSALLYEFSGPETPSRYTSVARATKVRSTTVADASRYYGIMPLQEPALANALTVKAPTIYSQIVPTTQRETAVSLAQINGALAFAAAGAQRIQSTDRWASSSDTGKSYFLPRSVLPGHVTIISVGTVYSLKDDRIGNIVVSSDSTSAFGANSAGRVVGSIDYSTGAITPSLAWPGTSHSIYWTPAVEVTQPAHTKQIEITLGTRGTVYSEALNPLPAPGTAIVDYRALGKWYRLRDLGNGKMEGDDPAHGVGSIDYVTGAMILTLGALPDVESSVIISWGSPVHYTIRAGATADADTTMRQEFTLAQLPVAPGTLVIEYKAGGVTYTATANSSGEISGGGVTGTLDVATGKVSLTYTTRIPDTGQSLTVNYSYLEPSTPGETTVESGVVTYSDGMTIGGQITAGTVVLSVPVKGTYKYNYNSGKPFTGQIMMKDNGSGTIVVSGTQRIPLSNGLTLTVPGGAIAGAIDYGTGVITWTNDIQTDGRQFKDGWTTKPVFINVDYGQDGSFGYRTTASGTATPVTGTVSLTTAPLKVTLTRTVAETTVPGSILFTMGGKLHFDRNGTIYTDLDTTTGSALAVGTVDYTSGDIMFSQTVDSASPTLTVHALTTVFGEWSTGSMFFRTNGSPIRPASFYVQATAGDGELLTGTSNQNGIISGPKLRGKVVQEMGVAYVEFGEMVTAAGNELENWYDPDNVVGGLVWRPIDVLPSTLRYNCVVLSNLPLDSTILGLDPVRLPSDGRVPIFRTGDVAVIHYLSRMELSNPATPGATYVLGEENLAEGWVVDANGKKAPTQAYSIDLVLGRITLAADLNTTALELVEPLSVVFRVEDLVLLSDVQINGELSLTAPLSRNYPLGSYVSSALLFGDINARVTNVFDQNTWSGAWSDALIGSQATAQYNVIDYPIEVTNEGAVTERWRLNFTSATAFQIIGENLGVIATGTTTADVQVINQLTGLPYFTMRKEGFGSGWATGNQIRFNTIGSTPPIWITRTVLPGATLEGDSFMLQLRGDVDA